MPPPGCCAPAVVRGLEGPGLVEARAMAKVVLGPVGAGPVALPEEAVALDFWGRL